MENDGIENDSSVEGTESSDNRKRKQHPTVPEPALQHRLFKQTLPTSSKQKNSHDGRISRIKKPALKEVIRGSVTHRVLETLGRLHPDSLVDPPTGTKSMLDMSLEEDEDDEENESSPNTEDHEVKGEDSEGNDVASTADDEEEPERPLKICRRWTVMPLKSNRISKEHHRVVVIAGPHKGYVMEELNNISVMEFDHSSSLAPYSRSTAQSQCVKNEHIRSVWGMKPADLDKLLDTEQDEIRISSDDDTDGLPPAEDVFVDCLEKQI